MRPGLFPDTVCVASAEADAPAALHPDEEALAQKMGEARRREFAGGRACARRAMRALGVAEGPVLRGPRRAPRWPEGVVGAITHTRGFCAAAVARSADAAGIGFDAEQWRPLSERALARICAPDEIAALRTLPGRPPELWGAVLFSAKECLYKAYFPLTGFFIGFRDATVSLHPDADDAGRFEARLARDDAPDAAGRRAFYGRYGLDGARVVTGLVVPRARATPDPP